MRWVLPINDEIRLKNKFLLWPRKLKNDLTGRTEWRWLESAIIKQKYKAQTHWNPRTGYYVEGRWENQSFN